MGFILKSRPAVTTERGEPQRRGFIRKTPQIPVSTPQVNESKPVTITAKRLGFTRKVSKSATQGGFTRKTPELPLPRLLYLHGYKRDDEGNWQLRRRCQAVLDRQGKQCPCEARDRLFTCVEHSSKEAALWVKLGSPSQHWEPVWKKRERAKAAARGEVYVTPEWAPAEERPKRRPHHLSGPAKSLYLRRKARKERYLAPTPLRYTRVMSSFRLRMAPEAVNEALRPAVITFTDLFVLKKELWNLRKDARKLERGGIGKPKAKLGKVREKIRELIPKEVELEQEYRNALASLNIQAECSFEISPDDLRRRNPLTEKNEDSGSGTTGPDPIPDGKRLGNRGRGTHHKKGRRRSKLNSIKEKADTISAQRLESLLTDCQAIARDQAKSKAQEQKKQIQPQPVPSVRRGFILKTPGTTGVLQSEPPKKPKKGGFTRKTPKPPDAAEEHRITVEIPV